MGVKINSNTIDLNSLSANLNYFLINDKEELIGDLRSAAYSPTFKKIVGIAMIKKDYFKEKKDFYTNTNNKWVEGEICNLPMYDKKGEIPRGQKISIPTKPEPWKGIKKN